MNHTMHALSTLTYSPFEKLPVVRPVDRLSFVAACCKGRRVLDLGAYDETEISKAHHPSWRWLHAEIALQASAVIGVDCADAVKQLGTITTGVGTQITYGRVEELAAIVKQFEPDLIVAGELIEHTSNTFDWLQQLSLSAPGAEVIITTPNATSLLNLLLAFVRRENCHEDHLHIYSYKTLATMAARLRLQNLQLIPYFYDPHGVKGRFSHRYAFAIELVDRLFLRPTQYLYPLTAFGWIVRANFPTAQS
jgi:2-polyprenyl-3-methyl-5-hydroxy-6-metoxy-1,4-benzoquinol methylase